MEKKIVETFKNKAVAIGTPNFTDPNKLFIYFGFLEEVNESNILLKSRNGYRYIEYDDIKSIREDPRSEF